jgi:hypothetical protein
MERRKEQAIKDKTIRDKTRFENHWYYQRERDFLSRSLIK